MRAGGLFPKLMDVPAAFPLAAKPSTCPGDTHRTLTWLVTQTVSDKVWPSTASTYGIHLKKKVQMSTSPSSALASRNRRSLVQAHTQHPPASQAHTHLQIPEVLAWSPCMLSTPAWILPLLSAPQVPYS